MSSPLRRPAVLAAALMPACLMLGCLAVGCGSDPKPVTTPTNSTATGTATATITSTTRPVTATSVPNTGTSAGIHISDLIRQKCGIQQSDAFFAFDSHDLRPADKAVLNQVALCFVSGPLAGQTLSLVGHADPRGEAEYNMQLGQQRASSVSSYMTGQATPLMEPAKVEPSSQGAIGATGTDEASWAQDRRVDVDVKQ